MYPLLQGAFHVIQTSMTLHVRREGSTGTHHDFCVRRSVVLRALQWLQTNNPYYKDVPLDPVALAQLPVDGKLPGLLIVTLTPQEGFAGYQDDQPDGGSEPLSYSFVPITVHVHRQIGCTSQYW